MGSTKDIKRELASSVSWTALVEEVTLNAIANVF